MKTTTITLSLLFFIPIFAECSCVGEGETFQYPPSDHPHNYGFTDTFKTQDASEVSEDAEVLTVAANRLEPELQVVVCDYNSSNQLVCEDL